MAKQKKGGLGKGLDALLSSGTKETVSQSSTAPAPAPKQAPSAPGKQGEAPGTNMSGSKVAAADSSASASKNENASEQKNAELPVKKVSFDDVEDQKPSEAPYAINEDKTTIKGVVQRQVASQQPQTQKKQDVKQTSAGERSEKGDERETDEIDIRLIRPNPDQPRINFKKEDLEELAESIKKNGLLQPILVRRDGQRYQIIAGERRWQACNLLGLKKVPVRIKEADDEETIILALIENIQRSDLNPIEEAYGYRRMMERGKMTQTQVAQAVSKGRSTIANALRLLELPEEAQQLLFEDKITAGHARAILSVPGKEDRAKLTQKIIDDKLSVRDTENLARMLAGKKDKKKVERPQTPKSYKTVARSLRDVLQADVRVKSTKDKNKIEITFKDEADLERIYRLLTAE